MEQDLPAVGGGGWCGWGADTPHHRATPVVEVGGGADIPHHRATPVVGVGVAGVLIHHIIGLPLWWGLVWLGC